MRALVEELRAWAHAYRSPMPDGSPIAPFNFYTLTDEPLIVYTTTFNSIANLFYMARVLDDRPAHFLVGFSWDAGERRRAVRLAREHRLLRRHHPRHSVTFICNSQDEQHYLSRRGLDTLFVNKNAFHDLDLYRPDPRAEKRYDALMNARMASFKRVELAREVERLALITVPARHEGERSYERRMRPLLRHATWLNYTGGDYRRLAPEEVVRHLNEARAGLILSEREGQCQASIEYLLCGLPVVSTPSRGGRDVFFHDDYVALVEPEPEAVRRGVEEMIGRALDPHMIRERTVAEMMRHRARLCAFVNARVEEAGGTPRSTDDWFDGWKNKLKSMCAPEAFAERFGEVPADG